MSRGSSAIIGFPSKPIQTTSGSKGRGLNLFTEDAVMRSSIKRADKIYSVDENGDNSTFLFWMFIIKDQYMNTYEWRDFALTSSPTKKDIATSIKLHLMTNVYQLPYNTIIESAANYRHTVTVGDGDEGVGGTVQEAINS
jgi:hypothetical protein